VLSPHQRILKHASARIKEQWTAMAQQSNLPDVYEDEAFDSRSYVLGRVISQIFHPILLNIASFIIVGYASLSTHASGLRWAGICILTLILPPTAFYYMRLRQGVYSDEDVSVREQRNELYLFGFIWVLIATAGLGLLGTPRPFIALMLCALAIGVIGGIVNLFWKISAHATAIASTAMIGLIYYPPLGVALWACAIIVGWARVRTHNHTPLQVLAGFGSAAIVILSVFEFIGERG
jgi:membrane-associated phospholipid phosphatase